MSRSLAAASAALFALVMTVALARAEPTTQPTAYPLKNDVVSGEPLGDHPVIETIDGREVHFASAKTADAFKLGAEAMQKAMDDQIVAATKDAYPLKTCVVSDEELGDMGDPIIYVNRATNQMVKFCCGSCLKKFKKDPGTYLPKLSGKKG